MSLANVEKLFIENLLHSHVDEDCFLNELVSLKYITQQQQLSIYRRNVSGAYEKVLSQIYPACLNVLGEEYFNQLCRYYRFEHPSSDSDLNNYGKHFPIFIQKQLELQDELKQLGYLSELAMLEWKWHVSYYAKNDESFSFEKLASIAPEEQSEIKFLLSNSFFLHVTEYPLLEIWDANKNDIKDVQEFTMPEEEIYFCMLRVDYSPEIELLNKKEYILLKNMEEGLPLAKMFETSEIVQEKLIGFIEKGWVTQFSAPSI